MTSLDAWLCLSLAGGMGSWTGYGPLEAWLSIPIPGGIDLWMHGCVYPYNWGYRPLDAWLCESL